MHRTICRLIASIAMAIPVDFVTAQNKQPLPQPDERVTYRSVDGVDLQLHLFRPTSEQATDKQRGGSPAIVFFFGGGWRSGSPEQFYPHCRLLADRGMVAMSAEYRVSSRHDVQAIDCLEDAKAAMQYVREHADELEVDPDRIAAGGGSAGGHLAAATALVPNRKGDSNNEPVAAALVLFNPALVLAPVEDIKINWPDNNLRQRLGVQPELISPYHHLDADVPPTVIFHGEADETVPIESAQLFANRARKLGGDVRLIAYPNQGHGFFNYQRDQKMYRQTTADMVAFLQELGWIQ